MYMCMVSLSRHTYHVLADAQVNRRGWASRRSTASFSKGKKTAPRPRSEKQLLNKSSTSKTYTCTVKYHDTVELIKQTLLKYMSLYH